MNSVEPYASTPVHQPQSPHAHQFCVSSSIQYTSEFQESSDVIVALTVPSLDPSVGATWNVLLGWKLEPGRVASKALSINKNSCVL